MTRTHDLLITNQLLYRLSYISIFYQCSSIIDKKAGAVNRLSEIPVGEAKIVRPITAGIEPGAAGAGEAKMTEHPFGGGDGTCKKGRKRQQKDGVRRQEKGKIGAKRLT